MAPIGDGPDRRDPIADVPTVADAPPAAPRPFAPTWDFDDVSRDILEAPQDAARTTAAPVPPPRAPETGPATDVPATAAVPAPAPKRAPIILEEGEGGTAFDRAVESRQQPRRPDPRVSGERINAAADLECETRSAHEALAASTEISNQEQADTPPALQPVSATETIVDGTRPPSAAVGPPPSLEEQSDERSKAARDKAKRDRDRRRAMLRNRGGGKGTGR